MSEERDSLEALASASARKSAGSYQRQIERQRADQRRRRRIALTAGALVLALGAGAAFLVTRLMQRQAPAEAPSPVVERQQIAPGQAERRQELETAWATIKDRQSNPGPGYKPLMDKGDAHLNAIRSLWAEGEYERAADKMDELAGVIDSVQRLDRAKEAALAVRQDAGAMAEQSKTHGAEQLVPALWAEAQGAYESAAERFAADDFDAAMYGWRAAAEAYGRAATAADQAKAAVEARKSFDARLIKRFDRATLEAHGEPALGQVLAVLEAGDNHLTGYRFAETKQNFEQAHAMIGTVELAVQQQIGAHYYAVLAGYRAADLLLLRSIGEASAGGSGAPGIPGAGEAQWTALRKTMDNLLLPAETVEQLTAARQAPYLPFAKGLMEDSSAAIATRWGPAVEASFAVGVQARLIEQMLNTDADAFASRESTEIRRSIAAIEKHAQTAGYPPAMGETLKQLSAALSLKPEYEAIRQSREIWTALARQLEDFDEAMKLLPRSGNE